MAKSFFSTTIVLGLFLLPQILVFGKNETALSIHSRVSIITTSPGEDLYTAFGHAAIRIQDSLNHRDWVYGYGEFDFKTPNFYPEFVRGTLLYTLSKDPFPLFMEEFITGPYEMREQVLNLDVSQMASLFEILENNYLPSNRFYRYDFFYDNCSTRIRDVLIKAIPGSPLFSKQILSSDPTFRDLINTYLIDRPWIRLGTDIILGVPADKSISPSEQAFLPFYLSLYLDQAHLSNQNKLVKSNYLLKKGSPLMVSPSWLSPTGVFWLVFLVFLSALPFTKITKGLIASVFLLMGILGFTILYLWLGTVRTSFGLNINILWASPLLVFLPFLKVKIRKTLTFFVLTSLFLFYVFLFLGVQHINSAEIPISLIVLTGLCYPFLPLLGRMYIPSSQKKEPSNTL